jgi:regulator of protease activity HflC (stomatin/prohibitin superfamily)
MAKAVAEAEGEARSQIARAHGEATSLIERARGEAEANRLRQASITPQLLAWRRLENQRALVERWNGDLPKTVLGEKSNLLLPFQTEQK